MGVLGIQQQSSLFMTEVDHSYVTMAETVGTNMSSETIQDGHGVNEPADAHHLRRHLGLA